MVRNNVSLTKGPRKRSKRAHLEKDNDMKAGGKKSLKCSIGHYTLETWSELRVGKGVVAHGHSSSANPLLPRAFRFDLARGTASKYIWNTNSGGSD